MPLLLSEHPERDRPRERFWAVGPVALTAQELLAILLGTGCAGRDALAVAGDLLARVEGSLRRLVGRPGAELARVPGLGRAKAARLLAALELGRRVAAETEPAPQRIAGPGDVQRFYALRLRDLAVEEFHVLALGSQSQVLADLLITRGILNSSLVHPREVFRGAIAEAAAGIIVVHNHPSGDPTPSADDRAVTRQLVDAGRLLDVPVYDHVIVGGGRYVSFAEAGLL
jgi:DNA repair protein RadC